MTFHARVLHEDLTFACSLEACRVKASYLIEVDRAARFALDFMLPVNVRVGAQVGGATAPVSLTSAASFALEFERRIQLKGNYYLPDATVLPPLYQASASIGFVAGRNQVTFEYDQPLAAVEEDRGYFRDGRMVTDFFYVLWPLKEVAAQRLQDRLANRRRTGAAIMVEAYFRPPCKRRLRKHSGQASPDGRAVGLPRRDW